MTKYFQPSGQQLGNHCDSQITAFQGVLRDVGFLNEHVDFSLVDPNSLMAITQGLEEIETFTAYYHLTDMRVENLAQKG